MSSNPLAGNCLKRSDWKPAPRNKEMQCVQDSQENFVQAVPLAGYRRLQQGYGPSDQVLKNIERITNSTVTVEALQSFQILSGIGESDIEGLGLARGHWCSMPAPDTPDDQDVFPKAEIEAYWKECVMPKAGYLNVLVCNNETSNVTGNYEAYLGLMATDKDVCYPLHAHVATEVYWQVGGQAAWRTWENCSDATAMEEHLGITPPDGKCLMSPPDNENSWTANSKFGSNYAAWHQKNLTTGEWEYKDSMSPHWHPSLVVHETDTTAPGSTHLLNFYLWGKQAGKKNQYHTGLGYFDMHKVLKAQNGTNRETRARTLIGTCATVEQIPATFHKKWKQDQHQWREGDGPPRIYHVQCPANQTTKEPPNSNPSPPPPYTRQTVKDSPTIYDEANA